MTLLACGAPFSWEAPREWHTCQMPALAGMRRKGSGLAHREIRTAAARGVLPAPSFLSIPVWLWLRAWSWDYGFMILGGRADIKQGDTSLHARAFA